MFAQRASSSLFFRSVTPARDSTFHAIIICCVTAAGSAYRSVYIRRRVNQRNNKIIARDESDIKKWDTREVQSDWSSSLATRVRSGCAMNLMMNRKIQWHRRRTEKITDNIVIAIYFIAQNNSANRSSRDSHRVKFNEPLSIVRRILRWRFEINTRPANSF